MICPFCQKDFAPSNLRQRYCSMRCRKLAASHRQTARLTAARRARRGVCVCAFCGKTFEPKNTLAQYCSEECKNTAWRRRHGIMPRAAAKPKAPRPKRVRKARKPAAPIGLDLAKIEAYLALPAAERYARRDTLTPEERTRAARIWNEGHIRNTRWNWLPH